MAHALNGCPPDCRVCRHQAAARRARRLDTLARNLRDAAGCALAARLQQHAEDDYHGWGDGETPWHPNCDGRAAPGWER